VLFDDRASDIAHSGQNLRISFMLTRPGLLQEFYTLEYFLWFTRLTNLATFPHYRSFTEHIEDIEEKVQFGGARLLTSRLAGTLAPPSWQTLPSPAEKICVREDLLTATDASDNRMLIPK
jgi:hypothetical protein